MTSLAYYDKAHLVPFGEYIPMRDVLPFKKITAGSIDLSPGLGPHTIALPGLPPFAALICYEAIFPGMTVDEAGTPGLDPQRHQRCMVRPQLGSVSQHLASARTRSVEEGCP